MTTQSERRCSHDGPTVTQPGAGHYCGSCGAPRYRSPTISKAQEPTMAVMATYTDRELLDALLDLYDEMPNGERPDWDVEGHDEFEKISVDRTALREAFRRLAS